MNIRKESLRQWILLKSKPLRAKSGYVSIESVFAMAFLVVLFLLMIGFFTFIHPYTTLNRDVHALATLAQRQGGLTIEDVDNFTSKIEGYRFVDSTKGDIEVIAYTTPGDMDAIGIDSLDEAGDYYVNRDSKEFIELIVTVPSFNEVLTPVARWFGAQDAVSRYTFKETFMSERY